MQHDHVLKKLNFELLTPSLSPGGTDKGLPSKITFDMFRIFVPLSEFEISVKILTPH